MDSALILVSMIVLIAARLEERQLADTLVMIIALERAITAAVVTLGPSILDLVIFL